MKPRCRIYFSVDSDTLTSEEIAHLLALEPDERWEAGSTYLIGKTELRNRFSRWSIVEQVSEVHELCEALDRIRDRVEGIRANFASLPASASLGLTVTITTADTVFGIGMDAEQLRYWASLRATVDVSIAIKARS